MVHLDKMFSDPPYRWLSIFFLKAEGSPVKGEKGHNLRSGAKTLLALIVSQSSDRRAGQY